MWRNHYDILQYHKKKKRPKCLCYTAESVFTLVVYLHSELSAFIMVFLTVTFGTTLTWLPFNPGAIKWRRRGYIFCTVPVKLPLSFDILKLKCYKFLLSWRYFPCHFMIGHQNSLSFGFSSLINCYIFAGREEKPTWTAFGLWLPPLRNKFHFWMLLKVKCISMACISSAEKAAEEWVWTWRCYLGVLSRKQCSLG